MLLCTDWVPWWDFHTVVMTKKNAIQMNGILVEMNFVSVLDVLRGGIGEVGGYEKRSYLFL